MNIQQFTNPQFWTSLFPNWWSIIINIIDIALVAWLLYFFDQGHRWDQDHDFGSWSYYLFLMQFLANFLGLTTISWLINQVITYGVIALVVIFSPEIPDWFRTSGSERQNSLRRVKSVRKRRWCRPMSRQ